MKRARRHRADAGRREPILQLDASVAVKRRAQDPLLRHAAAHQLAHAFDQHRGLAASGRGDHLHHSLACRDRTSLPGVQRGLIRGRRRFDSAWFWQPLAAVSEQAHRRVECSLQRVRVTELRIYELHRRQACEALLALDRDRGRGPQRGLEHVPVQHAQVIETRQPHAEDRELAGRGDTGKPLFGGVSKAGTRLLRPPGA